MKKFLYKCEYASGKLSFTSQEEMSPIDVWRRGIMMGLEKGKGTPLVITVEVAVEKPVPKPREHMLITVNRKWWDRLQPGEQLIGGDGKDYVLSAGEAVPVLVESALADLVEVA